MRLHLGLDNQLKVSFYSMSVVSYQIDRRSAGPYYLQLVMADGPVTTKYPLLVDMNEEKTKVIVTCPLGLALPMKRRLGQLAGRSRLDGVE